jgi:hypothetical protein
MKRDKLFILISDFADPKYSGQHFFCEDCALLEGVLATYPALTKRIDVERVEWPRPRRVVVERVGEKNQDLPLLILADDPTLGPASDFAMGSHEGLLFVSGKDEILKALSIRHGIPLPHP